MSLANDIVSYAMGMNQQDTLLPLQRKDGRTGGLMEAVEVRKQHLVNRLRRSV